MDSVCQFLFTKFKRASVLNTLFKIFRKDSVSVKQLLKFWILNKIFILWNFEDPYNNHWIMVFSLDAVYSLWNEVHLIDSEQGKYSEVLSWFIQLDSFNQSRVSHSQCAAYCMREVQIGRASVYTQTDYGNLSAILVDKNVKIINWNYFNYTFVLIMKPIKIRKVYFSRKLRIYTFFQKPDFTILK